MKEGKKVDSLISEYNCLIGKKLPSNIFSRSKIQRTLVKSADWTSAGATELLSMVDSYGAFMLRNALALAIVLNKEDGTLNL